MSETATRHALEWIRENPRRIYYAGDLSHELGRKSGFCTWCGVAVKKPRRKWCSDACVESFREHCDPVYQRSKVGRRDKGICSHCGCDASLIERIMRWSWRDRYLWHYRSPNNQPAAVEFYVSIGFNSGGHTWEVEHVKPVIEGGGGVGLDGLITLCIPCHKESSRALAARRRRAAR